MADTDITDINESWEGHSGEEVENFIKNTFSQKAATDELADRIEKLRADMVMAVEVDEETGDITLLYDEGNKTISDAYIDERGDIVIETEIG